MRLVLLGAALGVMAACSTSVRLAPEPAEQEPVTDPCRAVDCGPDATCVDGQCVPIEEDPCVDVVCDEGQVCQGGFCVDAQHLCDPPCGFGSICIDGECADGRVDEDGDGYPRLVDCDDEDPDVYPGVQRDCETDCGHGTQQCIRADLWSPCSAPLECACRPGDQRHEPCGRCGQATRLCGEDGKWDENAPACSDDRGECRPELGRSLVLCGEGCGLQERECGLDCQWHDASECQPIGDGACLPGQRTEGDACGNCGHYTLTCTSQCMWDEGGFCEGEGPCFPRDVSQSPQPCGLCGLGRGFPTCGDDCQWLPPVVCFEALEACRPGDTRPPDCGCLNVAGNAMETCSNDCTWERPADACPCMCVLDDARSFCVGETLSGEACGEDLVSSFTCTLTASGGCVNEELCEPAVL